MQQTSIMHKKMPVLAALVLCVLFGSIAADAQQAIRRGAATPVAAAEQLATAAAQNNIVPSTMAIPKPNSSNANHSSSSSSSSNTHKSSNSASAELQSRIRKLQNSSIKPSGWEKLAALLEQKKAATLAANSSSSSSKSIGSLPAKATGTTTTSGSSSSKGGGSSGSSSSSKSQLNTPIKINSTSSKSSSSSSSSTGTKPSGSGTPNSTVKFNSTAAAKSSSKISSKSTVSSGDSGSSSGSKPAADTLSTVTSSATAATASTSKFATKSNSTATVLSNTTVVVSINNPASSTSSPQGSKSNVPETPRPGVDASAVVTPGRLSEPAVMNSTAAAAPKPPSPPPPPTLAAAADVNVVAVVVAEAVDAVAKSKLPRSNAENELISAATSAANSSNSSASSGNNSSATVAVADITDGDAGVLIGGSGTINSTGNGTADSPTDAFANICIPLSYKPPPRGRPAPPLAIRDATLINKHTGRPVRIQGLNWFGFNVDMGMVDGLWAGGTDAATDFSKIAYQLRMLGFNAIRLPFAHKFLAKTDVWDLARECTAIGATKLKDRLIAPEDATRAVLRKSLPANPSVMRNEPGKCNTYLPQRNNQERLLFVVQQFIAQGFYVVLDYQPQGLEQEAYNLHQFVDKWKSLWKQITCLPNFQSDIAGRVLIDVMNEPDSMGIRWEAQGDRPGAEQLYLATADALWGMSPNQMLFMFEGTGQNMFGLNWGNGFITDLDIINSRGLSNPNSFFKQLVNKPYAKHSLMSPHLYPPSITKSTWLGEDLWKQSNTSFGYLQSKGYCTTEASCTRFPVLVGETGSAYEEEDDKKWLEDFADFVQARGQARQYNQIPLAGWMWWAYNENSGDTGGIVHNNWQDLHWGKLRYLMKSLDLRPWYKQQQQQPGSGRRSPDSPTHRRPDRDSGRTPRPPRNPEDPPPPPAGRAPSPPRNDDREPRRTRRDRRHRREGRSSGRHRREDRRPAEQLEQLFLLLTR